MLSRCRRDLAREERDRSYLRIEAVLPDRFSMFVHSVGAMIGYIRQMNTGVFETLKVTSHILPPFTVLDTVF